MTDVGQYYDAIADQYDAHFLRPIDRAEDRYIYDRLRALVDGKRVLDLGCGTAPILDHCDPAEYIGCDLSTGMLEQAYQRNGGSGRTFVHCKMEHIIDRYPELQHTFDVVLSTFGSFSYSQYPGAVVRTIDLALKPGGHFFVMAYSHKYRTREHHISADLPFKTYTLAMLEGLFFGGFTGVTVQGFNSLPDALRLPESVLYRLLDLDYLTLGRRLPERCWFLVAEGQRYKVELWPLEEPSQTRDSSHTEQVNAPQIASWLDVKFKYKAWDMPTDYTYWDTIPRRGYR